MLGSACAHALALALASPRLDWPGLARPGLSPGKLKVRAVQCSVVQLISHASYICSSRVWGERPDLAFCVYFFPALYPTLFSQLLWSDGGGFFSFLFFCVNERLGLRVER